MILKELIESPYFTLVVAGEVMSTYIVTKGYRLTTADPTRLGSGELVDRIEYLHGNDNPAWYLWCKGQQAYEMQIPENVGLKVERIKVETVGWI